MILLPQPPTNAGILGTGYQPGFNLSVLKEEEKSKLQEPKLIGNSFHFCHPTRKSCWHSLQGGASATLGPEVGKLTLILGITDNGQTLPGAAP